MIQTNIPLYDKNWFQTGGPAHFFAEPTNVREFQEALAFAHKQTMPIFVLGEGANILISDDGFDGLVIRPKLKTIEHISPNIISVGASMNMDQLIEYCLQHNLLGLEEFSGIPGSIGGSAYINLHYFNFLLAQFLIGATIIHKQTGQILNVNNKWFNFGYNQSTLQKEEHYLLSATFKLNKTTDLETAYARGRRAEIIRHRNLRYPTSHTCGSFFRNFYTDEVTLISNNKKVIWIAYYLDKIGVKGQLSVGDAIISYQHANMIVNKGNAKTYDIIALARAMQELVLQHFNIIPQPECQLIGFNNYPLHQTIL